MNYQKEIEEVIGDWKEFLLKIFSNLEKAGFDLDEFEELDHIAYRTERLEDYKKMKEKLTMFSKVYSDKVFNGRPILICLLKSPLFFRNFSIEGLEVLAPKENNKHKEGLEHAEFVIKIPLADFMKKYERVDFNLNAYNREENPELIVEFGDCAVKFHEQSLLEVRKLK